MAFIVDDQTIPRKKSPAREKAEAVALKMLILTVAFFLLGWFCGFYVGTARTAQHALESLK